MSSSNPPMTFGQRSSGRLVARLCAAVLAGTSTAAAAQSAPASPPAGFAPCAACHSLEPGKVRIGPSLAGVSGRAAGTSPGFTYSAALKSSGLVWDAATLDRFIAGPAAAVPGTRMTYAGLKDPQRRADVVAFLLSLHN